MDFQKKFYENIEKNHFTQTIGIYRSQTFWSFMKFEHIPKVCFVFKKQLLCLDSSVYA